jgi:hypothetical protein
MPRNLEVIVLFLSEIPNVGIRRGEILKNIEDFPVGLHVAIVNPGIHIGTLRLTEV